MSREHAEKMCGFADYASDDVIDTFDINECDGDITGKNWDGISEFRGGTEAICGAYKLDENNNIMYEYDSDGSQIPAKVPNKTFPELILRTRLLVQQRQLNQILL